MTIRLVRPLLVGLLALALAAPATADVVNGTSGPDSVTGTARGDTIRGFAGDDSLEGLGGDDILLGGRGADRADGGAGDDVLRGLGGDDRLAGRPGDDTQLGGFGGDRVFGGTGADRLFPGDDSRRDVLTGGSGPDRILARAHDWVRAGAGHDRVAGTDVRTGDFDIGLKIWCGPGVDRVTLPEGSEPAVAWALIQLDGCERLLYR